MSHRENIGVCIIVLGKDKKQVLLGKRLNSFRAGMYGAPGGRLELKESLEECCKRELAEETSIKSKNLKYVGVVRELQETLNFIHFVFCCDEFEGIPNTVEPDKCEGWEWYDINNLPANLLPGHKAGIDIFLNRTTTLGEIV